MKDKLDIALDMKKLQMGNNNYIHQNLLQVNVYTIKLVLTK